MLLSFEEGRDWIRCNVPVKDIIDFCGGMKCPNADSHGCPKLAIGSTNSKGVYTFSCLTSKCDLEHGDPIDMYMHLTGSSFPEAVEQICSANGIAIQKQRYEAKKARNGWQYWAWYDPENKLQLVKGRCKEKDMANQQRPASPEEIALGFALSKEPVFEVDEAGNRIPTDKASRDLTEAEVKIGFLLQEEPVIHKRTRGKKSGEPYEVRYNKFYKTHMVGCLSWFKPSWTYLANKWQHKEGPIHLVEGEKDSDVLDYIGHLSTTTGASSAKWTFEWANKLKHRTRYHYRDNDLPGARSLINRLEVFKEIEGQDFWVKIPGHDELKETHGEDLRDYLKAHTDDDFKNLLSEEHIIPVTEELIAELQFEFKEAKDKFKAEKQELKNSEDYVKTDKVQVDPSVHDPEGEEKYDEDKEPFCRPTETGNGKRFKHRYENHVKYVPHGFHSEWLLWTGTYWHVDRKNKKTFQLTQQVSEMIRREIKRRELLLTGEEKNDDPDVKYIQKLRRWSDTSESVSNRTNTLVSAGSEPGILSDFEEFDKDIYLFNCKNGTVNLKTGMFRPHNKADLITKRSNVNYNKNAKCPKFLKFLDEIMLGDKEVIRYIQRLLGYVISGLTREECMHMCVGDGQNGKGVLLELVSWIMGDYSITAEADMFLVKRSEAAASSDVARLMGVRMALASETNEGAKFNEAKLKALTSRDRITARFNHKDPFQFEQTHKILLATNKLITVRGKDRGIWRRLRVLRFDNNIPEDKVDKDLRVKLMDEASGILNWMIQGFLEYQQLNGLKPPVRVLEWRDEYRESMDYLQDFFETYCVLETTGRIDKKELFEVFYKWQRETIKSKDPYNYNVFCSIMVQHQFKEGRIGGGPRFYKGIRLKTDMEKQQEEALYKMKVEEEGAEELKNALRIEETF